MFRHKQAEINDLGSLMYYVVLSVKCDMFTDDESQEMC